MRPALLLVLFAAALSALRAAPADAKIFHSKEGALRLAFPDADSVKPMHLFLDEAQVTEIERASGAKVRSKLVTIYVGEKAGQLLGFAIFDTHVVRTLPETFMTVIGKSGRVRAVHILAFHEPMEYLPARPWLQQFEGRVLSSGLRIRQEVAGIAGATLSAFAVTKGIRRVLAIFNVALKGERSGGMAARP